MTEAARLVFNVADAHGGRFLLPRAHIGTSDSLACTELVAGGYARWLPWTHTLEPGIVLTGKPLPRAPSTPTPP